MSGVIAVLWLRSQITTQGPLLGLLPSGPSFPSAPTYSPKEQRALCSMRPGSQQPGQKAWPLAHHDRRQSKPRLLSSRGPHSSSGKEDVGEQPTAAPVEGPRPEQFPVDHQSDFHNMGVVTIPDTFAPLVFSTHEFLEHFFTPSVKHHTPLFQSVWQ